ncbi:MBL fold metallo-hydrolase [Nitrososphaera sp.]|uniref:MBL fold metallo-hydrolase n=1 Tax=Nitrososphaera sp. TaxID=1971748 RepID=UPI00307F4405
MLEFKGVKFHRTGHDGFRLVGSASGKAAATTTMPAAPVTVWIDPYQLAESSNDADIVLISHNHFDHLSMDDLKKVVKKDTVIVAARECVDQLKPLGLEVKPVLPGDRVTVKGVQAEAVHAYNTNKTFHPKKDNKVGFVVTLGGLRIYHAADTDDIPEMEQVRPDVALVPVSGTYVMTADEAAKAVDGRIRPRLLAIPMHYAAIVGSESDAARFKELVKSCPVEILPKD